jgi:CheY-like chemotaxis protein
MPKARVLIVEDEILIAKDLQKKLQGLGYEVPELATSGNDALAKAAEIVPDIVLMDIVLRNGLDGIETAERLQAQQGVPVIYVTAYADEQTLKRARITEPFGYLLKPFDVNLVVINIEIALYKHRMERQREELLAELQSALTHVKTLRGLLPICAWCKKIRNDHGYWQDVESYIHDHSDADFSHGICPECNEKYYNEFMEKRKKSKQP